jgi:hypothetical protein
MGTQSVLAKHRKFAPEVHRQKSGLVVDYGSSNE